MGLAPEFDMRRIDNTQMSVRDKLKSISLIRYADDFVVLHEDLEVIKLCKTEIEKWLSDIGLELKPSKTRVAHTLNKLEDVEPGFNFLGFNVKQFPVGKYQSGKTRGGLLGFKTIITPSKESQKRHYRKVAEVIDKSRGLNQAVLIKKLNPIIRGWCNYFSTVVSQKVFERLWHLVVWKLLKWGRHRHRNKGRTWIRFKYFKTVDGDNWVFATREDKNLLKLLQHSSTEIKRYVNDVLMITAVLLRSGMMRKYHVPFWRAVEEATPSLTLIGSIPLWQIYPNRQNTIRAIKQTVEGKP